MKGGIYHRVQIDFAYNSNHIEGSCLTRDQTRYIFETNTIVAENAALPVDDIIDTVNHFRCVDIVIDCAAHQLSESLIKQLHFVLKNGTSDSRKSWFRVSGYKKLPNEVGGRATVSPEDTAAEMKKLLADYNYAKTRSLDELLDFHYHFERIHPFQDGNGRVGRLILFKECLRLHITPFIIGDDVKLYYSRGLQNWPTERGFLRDTCLAAQDSFKAILGYFRIPYRKQRHTLRCYIKWS